MPQRLAGRSCAEPLPGIVLRKTGVKTPDFIGLKRADKRDRPPHIPDGPNCTWEGGEYRRLEAKNRAALREHFRELAKECLIQPYHPPVNVLGGNKEWRHRVTGKPIFTDLPAVDLSSLPTNDTPMRLDWRPCSPIVPIADDVSIPDFLKRRSAAVSESSDGLLEAAE